MSAVKLVIQLTLNIVTVVFLGMGAKGVLISSLVANVVIGIWMAGSLISKAGIHFSGGAARDLIRFGAPMMATQIATFFTVLC